MLKPTSCLSLACTSRMLSMQARVRVAPASMTFWRLTTCLRAALYLL
jgi:hypothetical protein